MEFSHDFQMVLAGGIISLATTIIILVIVTLLFRLDRHGENK